MRGGARSHEAAGGGSCNAARKAGRRGRRQRRPPPPPYIAPETGIIRTPGLLKVGRLPCVILSPVLSLFSGLVRGERGELPCVRAAAAASPLERLGEGVAGETQFSVSSLALGAARRNFGSVWQNASVLCSHSASFQHRCCCANWLTRADCTPTGSLAPSHLLVGVLGVFNSG